MAIVAFNEDLHSAEQVWRAGTPAFGLWAMSVCYVTRHQVDLIYPTSAAAQWDPDGQLAERLVSAELWARVEGGWWVLNPTLPRSNKPAWRVEIPRGHVPLPIRQEVYARDGYQCRRCGARESLSLDHIWPHSKGGPDTIENLQVLCISCNSAKGARVE